MSKKYYRSNNNLSSRIPRLFWYLIAMLLRPFIPIVKGRVICWSFNGMQYSCSPRYITQYLVDNNLDNGNMYWVLVEQANIEGLNKRVHVVRPHTLKYIYILYSSEFVITNCRTNKFVDFFTKKKDQKYIMTWHGPIPLKKIEKDAADKLPRKYIYNIK